jgi:hypothetical protein
MISQFERHDSASVPSGGPEGDYEFYCKLFDDMIQAHLCPLRRRDLNGKDGFSCSGCSKDTILNSLYRRRPAQRAKD